MEKSLIERKISLIQGNNEGFNSALIIAESGRNKEYLLNDCINNYIEFANKIANIRTEEDLEDFRYQCKIELIRIK